MSPFIAPTARRRSVATLPATVQHLAIASRRTHKASRPPLTYLAPPFPFSSPVIGGAPTPTSAIGTGR